MLVITNTDQNVVITPVLTLAECDEQLVYSRECVSQLACFGMMPSTIYFCFDLQKGEKAKREILDCVKVCVGYMTDEHIMPRTSASLCAFKFHILNPPCTGLHATTQSNLMTTRLLKCIV